MIAAVYCRKSTEQNGVGEEEKSVTRQMEHAKAYALKKGWTVADDCIFVDDGISGVNFVSRSGFIRLMNALKPRPPFQVLIMSEESRLGRESIETAYALNKLPTPGSVSSFTSKTGNGSSTTQWTRSCSRSRPSALKWSGKNADSGHTMP